MALALGEDRHEHVGTRHLVPPGRLHMDHRTLDHPLETRRWFRILTPVGDEIGQFAVDVFDQVATQDVEVDVAGPHDGSGILIVDQREQQMLQRGVFVPALTRESEGSVKGLFKTAREARQGPIL